jgi:NAD(P)-dependent dehydrogenase (short-subunit alcohol dehydrogenase family)
MTKRAARDRSVRAAPVDLAGRTVIVTGASPGSLGFATARTLADWGAQVVVTTRSNTGAVVRELSGAGRSVAGHPLDLTSAESVAVFAAWYVERHPGDLAVLVNNAGVHLDLRSKWTQPRLTEDGHEIHWRTNYLGPMQLTHLLLPLLEQTGGRTGDARVVNVASKLHSRGRNAALFGPLKPYHSWDAYGTSKLALVHATNEIARRYAEAQVRAYAVHPGSVYSHIADRGLEESRVLGRVRRAFAPVEKRMLLTPDQGAQTTLHCVSAVDLASGYYRAGAPAEPSAESADSTVAARLWDETDRWLTTAGVL